MSRLSMLQESGALLDEKIEAIGNPPTIVEDIDWQTVLEDCEHMVQSACDFGSEGKDAQHYLYEAVMQAVYGDGYWDWLGKVT